MALDLPSVLEGATELVAQLQELIAGLEDFICMHLTEDEKAELRSLLVTYDTWLESALALEHVVKDLQQLGHPTIPGMTIPLVLRDKLLAERAAEDAALVFLKAQPEAVSGEFNFSEPVTKEEHQ